MAAIILSALAAVVTAAIFIFFARTPFVPRQAGEAVLFFASMVFTLLHAGNGRSVQFPRRVTGWRLDDLIEGIGFLVTIAMLAIPYLVLAAAMDMEWLCWLYAAFTAVHWWVRSIPRTASLITERQTALCSGMPTLWKSGT